MKKTASALLLALLVVSAYVSANAQKARPAGPSLASIKEITVQFDRMDAVSEGQGVLIGWTTTVETRSLGFNVIRLDDSGQTQVNPHLITGAAYQAHGPVFHGGSYQFYDVDGNLGSRYVIQSLFLDGRTSLTNILGVRYTPDLEAETGRSALSYENGAKTKNGVIQKLELSLPEDLRQMVQASEPEADLNTHLWVVSQPAAKIGIRKEGFYRVMRASLPSSVFNATDPANWRLFLEGVEQAITVGAGGDYIEFYGKGIDTVESDTRMYYLIADSNPGQRIQPKLITSIGGTVTAKNYRATVEKKERLNYNSSIKNGPTENYWGRPITSTVPTPSQEIGINLTGIDTSAAKAVLTVKLQGIIGSTHLVKVLVNGHQVGFVSGTGNTAYSVELLVPTVWLVEGNNVIVMTENLSSQSSYFDSITINYARKYRTDANENLLSENRSIFYTPGYRKVELKRFANSNVRVFDTTFQGTPQEIINTPAVPDPEVAGTFMVKLPSHRPMVMYALQNDAFLTPATVTLNNPSTLSSRNNQADIVMIAHPGFMAEAQAWATYRSSAAGGNFSVKVVDVTDIFDEFGYGVLSSNSINAFLHLAQDNWQSPKIRYVLLLGDSSYDSRNYEGLGMFNMVPTKFVTLQFEETGSDEALGDFNHDGASEVAIGRIPARTGLAVTNALGKVAGFETPANQSLSRGALFAYDCPLSFDFEGMSIGLRSELPAGTPFLMVPRCLPPPNQNTPDPQAHTNLMNGLNTGKYLVNFAGHGTPGLWGSSTFFSAADAALLTNTTKQSVFTMLTCYNGVFFRPEPNNDSVSESLLKASGGAVATWASTTETTTDFQFPMGAKFYDEVGNGNIKRLGDLVKDAKTIIAGSDVGYSWVLLGDPALKVRE